MDLTTAQPLLLSLILKLARKPHRTLKASLTSLFFLLFKCKESQTISFDTGEYRKLKRDYAPNQVFSHTPSL